MPIGRRWASSLCAASLLVPVPGLAGQQQLARRTISVRQTITPGQATLDDLVLHQRQERQTFLTLARALRRQFRRTNDVTRASVERVLRDLRRQLRDHWAFETRTRTVSP